MKAGGARSGGSMHKFGHWSGSALIGFCLAAATALAAAPDSAGPPLPPDPQLQTDAREYGFSLFQVIAQIEQDYVRPVSRADLVEAAVTGLYEAVRRPVPPNLHQEIQLLGERDPAPFLTRTRESLGNHEALRGARAQLASPKALPRALAPYCSMTSEKRPSPTQRFVGPERLAGPSQTRDRKSTRL